MKRKSDAVNLFRLQQRAARILLVSEGAHVTSAGHVPSEKANGGDQIGVGARAPCKFVPLGDVGGFRVWWLTKLREDSLYDRAHIFD